MSIKDTEVDKNENPMVGIFYFVEKEFLVDAVTLKEAEPYGRALQHGGHYQLWESCLPRTGAEKIFKQRAYDAYPRGRVVFFPATKTFRIYADRCLTRDKLLLVKTRFRLSGHKVERGHDEHYQCARCNPFHID